MASITPRPFPPALPHGELVEVFPGVWTVMGTIGLPGPLPVRFSRNMVVIKEGERLILVNSVRLTEEGLARLDTLGKVSDVLRVAGFHGADDAFYKDRYGAKVWALKGQRYTSGFNQKAEPYFEPDVWVEASTQLPLRDARLYLFSTRPPEGILLLEREGGILVTGDALQNWDKADAYFSFVGKVMMKLMGFIKPHNVGPGWLKQARPKAAELSGLLELDFEHVLPAHGSNVIGGAKAAFRPAIERAAAAVDAR
jgi:hypothetical protein